MPAAVSFREIEPRHAGIDSGFDYAIGPPELGDGLDGRPHIGEDRLLARLRKVFGLQGRPDLADTRGEV